MASKKNNDAPIIAAELVRNLGAAEARAYAKGQAKKATGGAKTLWTSVAQHLAPAPAPKAAKPAPKPTPKARASKPKSKGKSKKAPLTEPVYFSMAEIERLAKRDGISISAPLRSRLESEIKRRARGLTQAEIEQVSQAVIAEMTAALAVHRPKVILPKSPKVGPAKKTSKSKRSSSSKKRAPTKTDYHFASENYRETLNELGPISAPKPASKLAMDLAEAKRVAITQTKGKKIIGSSNFDAVALKGGKEVGAALEQAGLSGHKSGRGMWKGFWIISPPSEVNDGAGLRTHAAEVMKKHLGSLGYDVSMYYQMD